MQSPSRDRHGSQGEQSGEEIVAAIKRRRSMENEGDEAPKHKMVMDESGPHSPQRDWFEDQLIDGLAHGSPDKRSPRSPQAAPF